MENFAFLLIVGKSWVEVASIQSKYAVTKLLLSL